MKQVLLASLIVIATMTIGLLAIAVAQKDARNRQVVLTDPPGYSQQSPVPISWPPATEANHAEQRFDWPPPPTDRMIFRANDSPSSRIQNPSHRPTRSLIIHEEGASSESPTTALSAMDVEEVEPSDATLNAEYGTLLEVPRTVSNASEGDRNLDENVLTANFQDGPSFAAPSLSQPSLSTPPRIDATAFPPSQNLAEPQNRGLIDPPSFTTQNLGQPATNPSSASGSPSFPNAPSRFKENGPPSEDRGRAVFTNAGSNNDRSSSGGNIPSYPIRDVPPSLDPAQRGSSLSPSLGAATNSQGFTPSIRTSDTVPSVKDTPGDRVFDGVQNPTIQILKKAPEEIQVGMPAVFTLTVRNVGNFEVHDVRVFDRVPRGTQLRRTNPQAQQNYDGSLFWSLGSMPVGAEQTISIELVPEIEGELGSVANVTFQSLASVRTVSTSPRLEIAQFADPTVLLGDQWRIRFQVTNHGTGTARNVTIEEDVPEGLKHPQGPALGLDPFDLAPGQSRAFDLELLAVEPGKIRNQVRVRASNAQATNSSIDVHVVAPNLQLLVNGPRLRYLERQAVYQLEVTNHGTAIARNVDLLAFLPRGMQFNNAANQGEYLSDRHAVAWSLEELAPGATARTELAVMPIEEGDFVLRLQCRAEGIQADPLEKQVRIEGRGELAFTIEDSSDPIEIDGQTTYTIRVSNVGTRVDQNVQVSLELPPGAQVVNVRAPVANQQSGSRVIFDPIAEMRAKDQHIFQITVRLSGEGLQVAKAFVKSQLRATPVAKEESTQVYLDR